MSFYRVKKVNGKYPLFDDGTGNLNNQPWNNVCPVRNVDTTGLQIYYNFNDNVNDQSGNGNNGTPTNLTYGDSKPETQLEKSGVFNGSSSRVIPPNINYNISTGFTLTAWIKTTGSSGHVFSNDGNPITGNRCWQWRLNSGRMEFIRFYPTGTPPEVFQIPIGITGNISVNNGQWRHIAAVFSNTFGMRTYVDGTQDVTNGTLNDNVSLITNAVAVGWDGYTGTYFNGNMDEVCLFNRALTATEIQKMAGGCPLIRQI